MRWGGGIQNGLELPTMAAAASAAARAWTALRVRATSDSAAATVLAQQLCGFTRKGLSKRFNCDYYKDTDISQF